METSEIIEKIRIGLKKCSFDNNIHWKTVRIKISKSNGILGGIKLHLMSSSNMLGELSLNKVLELNTMESMVVSKYVDDKLTKLSEKFKIDKKDINGRLYTKKEDFTPQLYIFNDKTPVKEIGVQDLLN
jgi:hypothetical protein